MSSVQKIVIGITEEELRQATQKIVSAMNDGAGEDCVDLIVVERATQAWLESIVERLLYEAAWWALDGRSQFHDTFNTRLEWVENARHAHSLHQSQADNGKP